MFPTGEAGIGYAAQQMFNAFVDVSNKPQDASARQVVLARVGDLAARFRNASDQIDAIQAGIAARTCARRSTSINALTTRIADLNRRIANVQGTGHAPNDLLDQRDTAIADLVEDRPGDDGRRPPTARSASSSAAARSSSSAARRRR